MKKLLIALTAALTLIPLAPAFAEQEPGTNATPWVKADIRASTTVQKPERPGVVPAIKKELMGAREDIKRVASTTRAEFKGMASSTRMAIRAKIDAMRGIIEKHREDNKERADAAREKARTRFGEHVERFVGNISTRFASTTARFISLADRADTRIEALEDAGHDMSGSAALLATTRTDITLAQAKILAVNTALEVTMSTTTPKSELPVLRALVKAAEDALKTVKEDLRKTLQSIKTEGGADAEATTTISTH